MTYITSQVSKTVVKERIDYAKLPSQIERSYLTAKINYAAKTPKVIKRSGIDVALKQVALSISILVDESGVNYKWKYRPEVVYDMGGDVDGGYSVPIPFLTQNSTSLNRRRSLNPFKKGSRRPDIVIVKNKDILWCGRAAKDHNNNYHGDNLLRVVEVKFPNDTFGPGQLNAYKKIAGGKSRLTILEVTEIYSQNKQSANSPIPIAVAKVKQTFQEYIVKPMDNYIFQPIQDFGKYISEFPSQVKSSIKQNAPWLFTSGKWVKNQAQQTWSYVKENGEIVHIWTKAQFDKLVEQVLKYTDITLYYLKKIDWWYIAKGVVFAIGAIVTVILVVAIAGIIATFSIPASIVGAFLTLMGMLLRPVLMSQT